MNIAEQLFAKAEEVTNQRNESKSKVHFEQIVKEATTLANDGRYSISIDTMLDETKIKLTDAGFKVKYCSGSQYESSYYDVSWDLTK